MARNNCPHCDSAYTLCPGHPELNPPPPAEGDGAVADALLALADELDPATGTLSCKEAANRIRAFASAPSAGGVSEAVDEYKRRADAYFQTAERQGIRAERLVEALGEVLEWDAASNGLPVALCLSIKALLRDQENKP